MWELNNRGITQQPSAGLECLLRGLKLEKWGPEPFCGSILIRSLLTENVTNLYKLTVCVRISHYHYTIIYPAITKMVLSNLLLSVLAQRSD